VSTYNIIASMNDLTVVSEYVKENKHSDAYQSEAALEAQFIKMLGEQSYTYLPIHDSDSLIDNLRKQLEKLNNFKFSDAEWKKFYEGNLSNSNLNIQKKTEMIQEDYIQVLERDDKTHKNVYLIDKENIYNNNLQVINQYVNNEGNHDTRYDVTILVNGLPLVHVELKRRGVAIREAFNQIKRYQRDSFWADTGLYEYVQVFVISNGTHTKYYSNTTRDLHVREENGLPVSPTKKTSDSFEFTSYWADAKNKTIPDLIDFTRTFFAKGTILNILTKYCVFTSDKELLVLRPYQIVATERILKKIEIATNYHKEGTVDAGGYIWHTTGSGKTLTSFKTAQLATKLPYIDKVLFVVDRKDLDYQTMKEYDRFEKGAANGNVSTKVLERQLSDLDKAGNPHIYKIIVTTIQKLDNFISKNPSHPIYDKHVVMIFDECHRSQFGDMHTKIAGVNGDKKTKGAFKHYYIFGFTGTPIFAENSSSNNDIHMRTTEQVFGERLHTYTIVDAINDENVLPFRIDYVPTMKEKDEDDIEDKQVAAIDREKAYMDSSRISLVTKYILDHFAQKTKRNDKYYAFKKVTNITEIANAKLGHEVEETKVRLMVRGFNSIFATPSIGAAKLYYSEFKKQMKELPPFQRLKVALIYSYGVNESDAAEDDGILGDENSDDTNGLDKSSRDFLDEAIKDYNQMFGTSYDTTADKFPNYYKDVSLRMKNREIDLLIVVNMFLTGFDAKTLNTLWVDKSLKLHGLLQAFSRTNRILNSVKSFGNIVCFRKKLRKATDDAISLFGDKDAKGVVLLKAFADYYDGYTDSMGKHPGYTELVNDMVTKFPEGEDPVGETNEKDFIKLFGQILRLRNILSSFDEFDGRDPLNEYEVQNYTSVYLDLHDKWRPKTEGDKEDINDDIVFEIGLVQQIEVNIDYILMLVQKFHDSHCKDKTIVGAIDQAISSSTQLRSKKELIDQFIGTVGEDTKVIEDWQKFVAEKKEKELADLISAEHMKDQPTRDFVANSFADGVMKTTGTDIDKIMPPMSRFGGSRDKKKDSIIAKLMAFFEKFFGLI
jgi:type I restriction enzyme R subunit